LPGGFRSLLPRRAFLVEVTVNRRLRRAVSTYADTVIALLLLLGALYLLMR
jgi:hypothetical protein